MRAMRIEPNRYLAEVFLAFEAVDDKHADHRIERITDTIREFFPDVEPVVQLYDTARDRGRDLALRRKGWRRVR